MYQGILVHEEFNNFSSNKKCQHKTIFLYVSVSLIKDITFLQILPLAQNVGIDMLSEEIEFKDVLQQYSWYTEYILGVRMDILNGALNNNREKICERRSR